MIVRKSAQTAWRTIGGEGVVLATDTRMLRGLNRTAARVWELIDGERPVATIGDVIAREFGTDPGRARADVEAFFRELLARNLIEVVADERG